MHIPSSSLLSSAILPLLRFFAADAFALAQAASFCFFVAFFETDFDLGSCFCPVASLLLAFEKGAPISWMPGAFADVSLIQPAGLEGDHWAVALETEKVQIER
eukprot:4529858-Pleurochrysis_carterae.AAC.4